MGDESRFRYRRDGNSVGEARSPRMERPAAAAPQPRNSRSEDALAELARLIGDQDPFADFSDMKQAPQEAEPARLRTRPEAAPAPQFSAPPVERRFDDWQPGRRGQRTPPPGTPSHLSAQDVPPGEPEADDWNAQAERGNVRQGYGSLSRRPVERPAADPRQTAQPEADDGYDDEADYAQQAYQQPYETARQPQPQQRGAQTQRYAQPADDDAGYAYSSGRQGQDQYDDYDGAYDPAYSDDGYMPPHDDDFYEPEPRKRRSRLLAAVAAVVVLGVVGVGGVMAYRMMSGGHTESASGQPPVIRAGEGPVKTAGPTPAQTTGSDGQKLIYDRTAGNGAAGNERVVPREEQPVDMNAAAAAAAQRQAAATEPKRVRTMTVRADGTVVTDPAPAPATPPRANAANGANGAAPIAYAPNQNPLPVAPPAPTPVQTAPATTASVAPAAPVAPPAPSAAAAAGGGYVVQVASQKSEQDALGSFKVLQSRYPQLLGSYQAAVRRADLGDRGVYFRAQVGPFPREQANELCQSLRAQGGDCLVQRN
ncbi:SPOR domain-containing protein [Xanthobacteraceae bacterium A53D]